MEDRKEGVLYLVATPIGNLDDITLRAIKVLEEADLIAAEDTRHTLKLLNHLKISKPLISYHRHNEEIKTEVLIKELENGKNIALVSDAGTPGISDPGEELVRQCMEEGIEVTSLPGPVACITALTMSGLPTRRFCFEAFLPSDKKERQLILDELKTETRTTILYEAPHRLLKTLKELNEVLGNRKITVCRELTKKHETVLASTLEDAILFYESEPPKGECVIVMEGKSVEALKEEKRQNWMELSLEEHMDYYLNRGMDKKAAMKAVAKDRNMQKREVYQALIEKC